jgi:serine/threonine protein kinase
MISENFGVNSTSLIPVAQINEAKKELLNYYAIKKSGNNFADPKDRACLLKIRDQLNKIAKFALMEFSSARNLEGFNLIARDLFSIYRDHIQKFPPIKENLSLVQEIEQLHVSIKETTTLEKIRQTRLAKALKVTFQEIDGLNRFIETKKDQWFKELQEKGDGSAFIYAEHRDLLICILPNKTIYVYKKNEVIELTGHFKKTYPSLEYDTQNLMAYTLFPFTSSVIRELAYNEIKLAKIYGLYKTIFIEPLQGETLREQYVLIQDFYNKGDLITYLIKKQKKLSTEETLKIAKDCLKDLKKLHEKNILHLDIKLENILIRTYWRDATKIIEAKLTDLGASCFANEEINIYLGTKHYRSPELWKYKLSHTEPSLNSIGAASDLFSFGLVLYTIINDSEPQIFQVIDWFDQGPLHVFVKQISENTKSKEGEPESPQKVEPGILQSLDKGVIGFALIQQWCEASKEPSDSHSLEHLVWEMLRFKPEDRITVDQALAKIEKLDH